MKFEENKENEEALERLKAAFETPRKGDMISWQSVESVMGRHREDRGGWSIIRRFRRWIFRKHRIVTFCADGEGIRLLTDRDAAREVPELRQRKAYRQLGRGARELEAVDQNKLSSRERSILAHARAAIRQHRRETGRSIRALDKFLRGREPIPVPPAPPPRPERATTTYAPREGPPRMRPRI